MSGRMPMLKIPIKKIIYGFLVLAVVLFFVSVFVSTAPSDFPERKIVSIKSGQYLSQVSEILAEENIIRSPFVFKVFVVLLSGHRQVRAADYLFDEPQSALRVAYRVIKGIQGLPTFKITVTEGMTAKQIGATIKKTVPDFDLETFMALSQPYEGYLFPDTYFIYESTTPQGVVDLLRETFKQKIKTELLAIQAFGKPLEDVIKMASIVEKEARDSEDRKIIAGILWKRMEIGMPLQVDAPFYYTLGKDSASITLEDLSSDSPYNTYKNKGLPPTPISNPGLDAIEATVMPIKTDYLFYLSDRKGDTHYAVDHDGHVKNKNKYIR